jgi:hypothetical protein
MDAILITCPQCGKEYLTTLSDKTELCPICKEPVSIVIRPGTVEVKRVVDKD